MKTRFGVLKITVLMLCVGFAVAACDFFIDDDYEDVMTDDAALSGFFMQFTTALSEFVAQDPTDIEAVDASMLRRFFRNPVYVYDFGSDWWDRYMYWDGDENGDNDLKAAFVDEFETSMGLDDPIVRYRLESVSVSDTRYGYRGFAAYPPGKHLWAELYVRRTEGAQRDLAVWIVGVVVEGDQFFIWYILDMWDHPNYYNYGEW